MNGEQSINGARNLPDDTVVVVPVSNVIFPGVVFPIVLDRPSSVAAAQQALREQHPLVLALQQDVQAPDPGPQSLHRMGTLANVLRYVTGPDGAPHVACQGVERFEINEWVEGFPFLVARGRRIPEPEAEGAEIEARFLHLRSQALEALQLAAQLDDKAQPMARTYREAIACGEGVATTMRMRFAELKPHELPAMGARGGDAAGRLEPTLDDMVRRMGA